MAGIIAQGWRPRSRHEGVEALLRAFTELDPETIQALVETGCDLDATRGGLTVLMRAVLRRDGEAVEWILAAGADSRVASSDGRTALDLARDLDATELVDLLILAGGESGEIEVAAEDPAAGTAPPEESLPVEAPDLQLATSPGPLPHIRHAFSDRFDDGFDDRFEDRFDDL